ncbi:MAG: response regulator [Chloroflexi bacterium]|nr:response regulator [Chloroflexota bacterium]
MKKKILIVEDDPDILMAVSDAVESEGFLVAAALDISVAEALIRDGLPDVAIIDHGLPDGTGDEFCKKLCAAGNTPVIMYTAQAQRSTVMDCINSGAVDYVLKGSGIDELIARVLKHAS